VRVQLLDGLKSSGMKLIAAGAEEVGDDVPALECVVDGVVFALLVVSDGTYAGRLFHRVGFGQMRFDLGWSSCSKEEGYRVCKQDDSIE
jgi:hypothetical protein